MISFGDAKIVKVISGGQTGGDEGGIEAGRQLNIPTGGTAPLGYITYIGNNYDLRDVYGLKESTSPKYPPRTLDNVLDSDVTIIVGNIHSPGCALTKRLCIGNNKPYYHIETYDELKIREIASYIQELGGNLTINIAGNREQKVPGIYKDTIKIIKKLINLINAK